MQGKRQRKSHQKEDETEIKRDRGEYVGADDDEDELPEDDGLGDIWKEMNLALEISKALFEDLTFIFLAL